MTIAEVVRDKMSHLQAKLEEFRDKQGSNPSAAAFGLAAALVLKTAKELEARLEVLSEQGDRFQKGLAHRERAGKNVALRLVRASGMGEFDALAVATIAEEIWNDALTATKEEAPE